MNFNNIIIFSPPRTGSTLVYNIFKSVFTDKVITKTHEFVYNTNDLFVVTIRHPYNSILSILMCKEQTTEPVNNNNLTYAIYDFMTYGGKDYINNITNILTCKNIIVLNYDKFVHNYDYIFQIIENKIGMTISNSQKIKIYDKNNITSVNNLTNQFNSFKEYCSDTQYHGKHISKYEGMTDYTQILSKSQIEFLNNMNELSLITGSIIKIDQMNSKYYKKTVVQVFKYDFTPEKLKDVRYNYHGIGDLIRGCLSLFRLSKELNFKLVVDIRHHGISKYTQIKRNLYENLIDIKYNDILFFFNYNTVKTYITTNFETTDVILLLTNSIYNHDSNLIKNLNLYNLNNEEKHFLQNLLIPNDELNAYINNETNKLNNNFNIIHFRLNDSFDENIEINQNFDKNNKINKNVNLIQKIIDLDVFFTKYYEPGDILLINNLIIKQYFKRKYNCITFDTHIQHLGTKCSDNNQIIFDNLFEFFLQKKSNQIKTFSDYEWISGFVFWNSLIFDIPLINMANSNTFIKSICNNSNIIIPKNVTIINDTSIRDLNQPKIKSAEFDLHSSQSIPSKEIQFVPDEKNNQSEQLITSVIGSNAEKYNTNTLPNITFLQTENIIKNDDNVEYNIINDTDNSSLTQQTVQFAPKLLNFSYSIIDEKVQKNGLNADNANKLKSTRNVKTPVKIVRKNLNMSYN